MALKKLCGRCQKKIVPIGTKYCSECEREVEQKRKQRHRKYQNERLKDGFEKRLQRFYQSREWKRIRDIVRTRDKGLCLLCLSMNKISYLDTVHHIEEVKENYDKRLELDNLISLCESCHQHVHSQYKENKKIKEEMQKKLRRLIHTIQGYIKNLC